MATTRCTAFDNIKPYTYMMQGRYIESQHMPVVYCKEWHDLHEFDTLKEAEQRANSARSRLPFMEFRIKWVDNE